MEFVLYFVFFVAIVALVRWQYARSPQADAARKEKAERERQIVCQFCDTRGSVTTAMYQKKGSISGGKATGAILTGGVSLLATGLARKGWVTQLRCSNCGMTWEVTP